jgi:Tfp pilus assembly protein PilX
MDMKQNLHSTFSVSRHRPAKRVQRGVLLEISLILLILLTLLGAMMARSQLGEERMSQNEDNRQMAMQAAEAGLRAGEDQIYSATPPNFASNANGLFTLSLNVPYQLPSMTLPAASQTFSYPLLNLNLQLVAGSALAGTNGSYKLAYQPYISIFQLPPVVRRGACGAQNCPTTPIYEISSYAYGQDSSSIVTLQSFYQ